MKKVRNIFSAFLVLVLTMTYVNPVIVLAAEAKKTSVPKQAVSAPKINTQKMLTEEEAVAETHILVQMDKGVNSDTLAGHYGISKEDIQVNGKLASVAVPEGTDPIAFSNKLEKLSGVDVASPSHAYSLLGYTSTPNDPRYTNSSTGWWEKSNGLNIAPIWSALNNVEYGPRATGDEIKVAVLDSGYYLNHPDRGNNIVPMKDECESLVWDGTSFTINTDNDVSPTPLNVYGNDETQASHGICVAGEISSAINNGLGVAGVSYDNKVMIYKVAGKYYRNGLNSEPELVILTDAVVNAIDDAIAAGANIITMSFGSPYYDEMLQQAINRAHAAGVMVVASTGNDGTGGYVSYPGACNYVIGVGSYDYNGTTKVRATHTNYGSGADPDGAGVNNGKMDILAPGVNVYGLYSTSGYNYWNGTSMAAPAFAGVAALIWRFAPNYSVDEITNVLLSTADPDGGSQPSTGYGYGYVNPIASYNKLKADNPSVNGPVLTAPETTNNTSVNVSWTPVNEAGVTYSVYLNGSLKSAKQTGTTAALTLTNNQTNEVKIVTNSKTNWYKASVANIVCDATAPVISSLYYSNKNIYWAHNERTGFTQEYSIDNGTFQTVSGSSIPADLPIGNHSFTLRVTDVAKNVSTKTINFTVSNVVVKVGTSITVNSPTFTYSSSVGLYGRLTDATGAPVANKTITLAHKVTSSGSLSTFATVSTDGNGNWSYSYNPSSSWERIHYVVASFAGDSRTNASSATGKLTAKAYLSTPKKSVSTPRAKRSFTIKGAIKPKFKSGTYPVKAMIYKKNSKGSYVYYKSVRMKASNYSSYSKLTGSTSISSKGSYRVCFKYSGAKSYKGYYFGTTYSSYNYFKVK